MRHGEVKSGELALANLHKPHAHGDAYADLFPQAQLSLQHKRPW